MERKTLRNIGIGGLILTAGVSYGAYEYSKSLDKDNNDDNYKTITVESIAPRYTATPTPTSTPIATPEPTPIATPEALSPIEQKMQLAPDIEGFTKQIQTINGLERVTYVDKEGNYLGEYYKNVELEGKEVGAVVLIPSVVEKLAKAKLAEGNDWIIFIPADLSDIKDPSTKVTMETVDVQTYKKAVLKVSFDGETVDLSSPVINSEKYGTSLTKTVALPEMPVGLSCYLPSGSEIDQNNLTISGNFSLNEGVNETYPEGVSFGKKMASTNKPIGMFIASQDGVGEINNDNILTVGDSPVFIASK